MTNNDIRPGVIRGRRPPQLFIVMLYQSRYQDLSLCFSDNRYYPKENVWRDMLPADVLGILPSMAAEFAGVGVHGVLIAHD